MLHIIRGNWYRRSYGKFRWESFMSMVTGIYDLRNSGNPLGILTWHRLCLSKTSFILNGCRSRTPSYILGTYSLFNYNWFLTYNTALFLYHNPKLSCCFLGTNCHEGCFSATSSAQPFLLHLSWLLVVLALLT